MFNDSKSISRFLYSNSSKLSTLHILLIKSFPSNKVLMKLSQSVWRNKDAS